MSPSLKRANIVVKKSPIHGFGVFAQEDLYPGQIIEECYTLLVSNECMQPFHDYYFKSHTDNLSAMPLGYGCIYNHDNHPNAIYDCVDNQMTFTAQVFIRKGDEILISYGKGYFRVRGMIIKTSLRRKIKHFFRRNQLFIRFTLVTLTIYLMNATLQCYVN